MLTILPYSATDSQIANTRLFLNILSLSGFQIFTNVIKSFVNYGDALCALGIIWDKNRKLFINLKIGILDFIKSLRQILINVINNVYKLSPIY